MRKVDVAFTALLLAMAVVALTWALDWPFRSRLFVHVIAVPMIVLTAAQLIVGLRGLRRRDGELKRGLDLRLGGTLPPLVVVRRGLAFTGWVGGFGVVMWLLGFAVGGLVMAVLYMVIAMRERFLPVAGMVLSMGLVFFLMRTVLHVPLPRGALLRMLGM